jgi:hypothetical protein
LGIPASEQEYTEDDGSELDNYVSIVDISNFVSLSEEGADSVREMRSSSGRGLVATAVDVQRLLSVLSYIETLDPAYIRLPEG